MNLYILTMIVSLMGPSGTNSLTAINQEYTTQDLCNKAKMANREALTDGKIILATCTMR